MCASTSPAPFPCPPCLADSSHLPSASHLAPAPPAPSHCLSESRSAREAGVTSPRRGRPRAWWPRTEVEMLIGLVAPVPWETNTDQDVRRLGRGCTRITPTPRGNGSLLLALVFSSPKPACRGQDRSALAVSREAGGPQHKTTPRGPFLRQSLIICLGSLSRTSRTRGERLLHQDPGMCSPHLSLSIHGDPSSF